MRKKRIRADNINPVGSEWILYYTDTARQLAYFALLLLIVCFAKDGALPCHCTKSSKAAITMNQDAQLSRSFNIKRTTCTFCRESKSSASRDVT